MVWPPDAPRRAVTAVTAANRDRRERLAARRTSLTRLAASRATRRRPGPLRRERGPPDRRCACPVGRRRPPSTAPTGWSFPPPDAAMPHTDQLLTANAEMRQRGDDRTGHAKTVRMFAGDCSGEPSAEVPFTVRCSSGGGPDRRWLARFGPPVSPVHKRLGFRVASCFFSPLSRRPGVGGCKGLVWSRW